MALKIDNHHLEAFVAIVDSGSFNAGARAIGCTQPAISIRIKNLEAALENELFDRSSKSLRLTREGMQLLPFARQSIDALTAAGKCLQEWTPLHRFRIGMIGTFLPDFPEHLEENIRAAYPRAQIEFTIGRSGQMLRGVTAGNLDICIAKREFGSRVGDVLGRQNVRWYGSKAYTMPAGKPLDLVLLTPPCSIRLAATEALDLERIRYEIRYSMDGIATIINAVAGGKGLSPLNLSAQAAELYGLKEIEGFPELAPVEVTLFAAGNTETNIREIVETTTLAFLQ